MRKIFYTCLLLLAYTVSFSQNIKKLEGSEKQAFEQKMRGLSGTIHTLQCNFVQERTSLLLSEKAVAKGTMLYKSPSMLRWEYVEPTPSLLLLNGSNAALFDASGKRLGNEKILKQIGGVIISMINGDSFTQNNLFSSIFYEIDNEQVLVVLEPVQKQLKNFYKKVELIIDKKKMLASSIILYEQTGDKTTILLSNIALNIEIPPSKFTIP